MLSDLRYRLRAVFRRSRLESELDDELRFHLAHEAEKYAAAGLSGADAMRKARLAFGGVETVKEQSRDARGTVLLETALQDLRYAVRGLRAKPGFSAGLVLTIALGIGANTAMFGIVDRLLYRTPPHLRDAGHVHRIYMRWMENGAVRISRNTSFARFLDLRRGTQSFSTFAAFQTRNLAVGDGDDTRERPVTVASSEYFELFDAPPALGRYFGADEDRVPAGANVVVLGYAFWQLQYGGRRDVIGKQIRVDRALCTIVGVAASDFTGVPDQGVPTLYIPITAYAQQARGPSYAGQYSWSWLEIVARRKPDVTVSRANADLTDALVHSWNAQQAGGARRGSVPIASVRAFVGPVQFARGPMAPAEAKVVAWIGGVSCIVLLIACANVANLLLSRAIRRRREIAVRLALGVSRGRLIRQLLTESLVLACAGGAVGLLVAQWGGNVMRATLLRGEPAIDVITDARTLVVAAAATFVVALASGLMPVLQAFRIDVQRGLNAGERDSGADRSRLRAGLLVFQATLSVVLLVGAGVFVRSLVNVRDFRLGYDAPALVVVQLNARGVKLTSAEAIALEDRALDAARGTPGVLGATKASSVPFWSNDMPALTVPGVDSVARLGQFMMQTGGDDFFRVLGTRILRGRAFGPSDGPHSPPVMLVSDGMASVLWPGQNPIGKCVRIAADTACTTVIGVAEEMRIRSLTDAREFTFYLPIAQDQQPAGTLLVRIAGDAGDYVEAVRRSTQRVMPGASYASVIALRSLVDPRMQSWRFGATMFVAFGVLALVLAGVGLYSLVAYGVAQRQREIGVRIALGASRGAVVRLVIADGARLVVLGIALGGSLAFVAGRWIAPLLFQESPQDPVVFAAVTVTLTIVALIATAFPAAAATRVDPNVALRSE